MALKLTTSSLTKYLKILSIETCTASLASSPFELGKITFNTFGVTRLEVSKKKIRSRKIISVSDDMLNNTLR
jgi:hypothetical protein